jgi:hypothetical protein
MRIAGSVALVIDDSHSGASTLAKAELVNHEFGLPEMVNFTLTMSRPVVARARGIAGADQVRQSANG